MSLKAGTRIGVYEIVAPLGAGGMGEVYRATDTRLGRAVALKTLPPEFAQDADRRARFEREARTLATLNHPHIAQIYGLEVVPGADGTPPMLALVMELVEGEDLAQRIARGPVPLDEAVPLGLQIAEGLEAAHEAGIVHRDLKPANIRVTAEGVVKVLDFGLAKPTESAATSVLATHSPTLTSPALTTRGVVLGTAAYMAPEQAKGKPVDRRADIWAFGCVLYELLTGRRAFDGEDVPEILGAIIKTEPDWTRLPGATPRHLRTLLIRCLAKDKTQRLQHIGDARLELASPETAAVPLPAASHGLARWSWAAAGAAAGVALTLVAVVSGIGWLRTPPSPPLRLTRFALPLSDGVRFTSLGRHLLSLSPDGSSVVFVANQRLYIRHLDRSKATEIPGTQSRTGVMEPAFSPDGRAIAYFSNDERRIRRIAVDGGASQPVCDAQAPFGLSWTGDDLVFGQGGKGIMRVVATGGEPTLIAPITPPSEAASPQLLGDGNWLQFTITEAVGTARWERGSVVVQSLATGERRTLVREASDALVVGNETLVYRAHGALYSVFLDRTSMTVRGEPTKLVDGLRIPFAPESNPPTGQYAISRSGLLAYVQGPNPATEDRDLHIIDDQGNSTPVGVPKGRYSAPRVSPDGRLVAYVVESGEQPAIWVHTIGAQTPPRRLTFGTTATSPVWSPDSQWIYFNSDRQTIWRQRADGSQGAETLSPAESAGSWELGESLTPDGKALIVSARPAFAAGSFSLRRWSLADGKIERLIESESATPHGASTSPDGRWIAYAVSGGSGSTAFVEPLPPTGAKFEVPHQIEAGHAVWVNGGRGLMFQDRGSYFVVDVETTPSFRFGAVRPRARGNLVETIATSRRSFDIMPDGRRILGVVGDAGSRLTLGLGTAVPQIDVVLNWPLLVRRTEGTGR